MKLENNTAIDDCCMQRVAAWDACCATLGADVNPQAAEQLERSVGRICRV